MISYGIQMLEMQIQERTPRILYIGDNRSSPGIMYHQALRKCGYNIFHVGNGAKGFDTDNLYKRPYVIKNEIGPAQVQIIEFKLTSLLDIVGYDFDAIVHVQNWLYFTDMETSPLPFYFYCTEIAYPRVPRCAWYVLYPTEAIGKFLKRDCTWVKGYSYHPHSVMITDGLSVKYPSIKRTIQSSFCGELYSLPLYQPRREIIKYLQENSDIFEAHYEGPRDKESKRAIEGGRGRLQAVQYCNLMLKTRCAFNVPSIGGANFRDIEAPASGSMLVTISTPDHYLMGFEDGINCKFYTSKEEALDIIQGDWDPEIAKAGWDLIMHGRIWYQHQNTNIVHLFKYRGIKIEKEKTTLKFWVADNFKINEMINQLKPDLITKYNRKDSELTLYPVDDDKIANIIQKLGFIEWRVYGHTIYHRIKELGILMKNTAAVQIPKQVEEQLERLK